MKSPFKFLDAYTKEDKNIFFGRDTEIEELYGMVHKSNLIIVYGQSGTGKTSLVQCGLSGKFDVTDWFPLLIRRNSNINQSLSYALSQAAGGKLKKDSIIETTHWLFKNYLRPVYLIFDQFEELFILGSETERVEFINSLKQLLEADFPCKLLIVMREEYIAQLYDFEKFIPTLLDRRLRVEPMTYSNISKVITQSCEKFNISFEDPARDVKKIIENLGSANGIVELPLLQIYLDMYWREDVLRTYPGGIPDSQEGWPRLEFSAQEIQGLGEIESVLEKFLNQTEIQIKKEFSERFPETGIGGIGQVLDIFVTKEGTKCPVAYERNAGSVILDPEHAKDLDVKPEEIEFLLEKLESFRIIRFSESQIELSHDTLARLIDKNRSAERRHLQLVRSRIEAAMTENEETGVFLSRTSLNSIIEFLPLLKLTIAESAFIESCLREADRADKSELARQKENFELKVEALAQKNKAKRNLRLFVGAGVMVIILFFGGKFGLEFNQVLNDRLKLSNDTLKLRKSLEGKSYSLTVIESKADSLAEVAATVDSLRDGLASDLTNRENSLEYINYKNMELSKLVLLKEDSLVTLKEHVLKAKHQLKSLSDTLIDYKLSELKKGVREKMPKAPRDTHGFDNLKTVLDEDLIKSGFQIPDKVNTQVDSVSRDDPESRGLQKTMSKPPKPVKKKDKPAKEN